MLKSASVRRLGDIPCQLTKFMLHAVLARCVVIALHFLREVDVKHEYAVSTGEKEWDLHASMCCRGEGRGMV